MNGLLIVTTSLPNAEIAKEIAEKLIAGHFAACVQIHDSMLSIYRWEGRICQEQEVLLVAKTTAAKWADIRDCIRQNHPYKTPEIIAQAINEYDGAYGEWIQSEVDC